MFSPYLFSHFNQRRFGVFLASFLLVALLLPTIGQIVSVARAEDNTVTSSTDPVIQDPVVTEATTSTEPAVVEPATTTEPTTENSIVTEENLETPPVENEPTPTPVIATGDAGSVANVLNVVNTNITDSETFFAFLNYLSGLSGNVIVPSLGNGDCVSGCFAGDTFLENQNAALLENNIDVMAGTGQNSILNSASGGLIIAGNAGAAANVANIVNTNISNSNYFLLIMNSFASWAGNLILPPASFFANGGATTVSTITNNNEATILNNVSTTASSGNNEANSGTILTGDAAALSNVVNVANTNVVNSDQIMILVRVTGNWGGNVFSPPPGLSWMQTPEGIVLYSSGLGDYLNGGCCSGSTNITNNNSAAVTNNISVLALTGENRIQGEGGGVISTGNASAVANVLNMVNTNVVGRNWLLAMVNVFGDWNGHVAFGQPDLWVAGRAEVASNPIHGGSEITYIYDLMNRGTADATQVKLLGNFNRPDLVQANWFSGNGGVQGDGSLGWTLPTLPAGASMRLTFKAQVSGGVPPGTTLLNAAVTASSYEPDANPNDNSDLLALTLTGDVINGIGRPGGAGMGTARLTIEKSNNASGIVRPSSTVGYKIIVRNGGSASAFDTVVTDELRDPWGRTLSTNSWNLGIVYPSEEIVIEYDTRFSSRTPTGHYINYATLEATDNYYNSIFTPKTSSSLYLVRPEDQQTPGPVIVVNGATSDGGGGSTNTTEENQKDTQATEETSGGGAVVVPQGDPVDLEELKEEIQTTGISEPTRRTLSPEELQSFPTSVISVGTDLLSSATSNIKANLLAMFSVVPFGGWTFFVLIVLILMLIAYRALREEN